MSSFMAELNSCVSPELDGNVFISIWKESERTVLHSLVASFGFPCA